MTKCQHQECQRISVLTISHEEPHHEEFRGQTHDCCGRHKWEFEVGDKVYESFGGRLGSYGSLKSVARKTKTQYIVGNRRYRVSDLREIGWNSSGSGFRSAPELISAEGVVGERIKRNQIIDTARYQLENAVSAWQKDRSNLTRLKDIATKTQNLINEIGTEND